jgi:enamine deaminase RidA (YjgF/YER057c/UK114 family)
MVQIFIADLADFDEMNRAWDAWIDPDHLPARATVQAQLHEKSWRLEVTATAAIP